MTPNEDSRRAAEQAEADRRSARIIFESMERRLHGSRRLVKADGEYNELRHL